MLNIKVYILNDNSLTNKIVVLPLAINEKPKHHSITRNPTEAKRNIHIPIMDKNSSLNSILTIKGINDIIAIMSGVNKIIERLICILIALLNDSLSEIADNLG